MAVVAVIDQDKFDLRNEFGVSFDEYVECDNIYRLASTIHLSYEVSNGNLIRNSNMMSWLLPGEQDPASNFYDLFPKLKPKDGEPILANEMMLPDHWEAAI